MSVIAPLKITLKHPADPLVKHATAELARYVRRLFGFTPAMNSDEPARRTIAIAVEGGGDLSDQGYRFGRNGEDLNIVAGSPRSALWQSLPEGRLEASPACVQASAVPAERRVTIAD